MIGYMFNMLPIREMDTLWNGLGTNHTVTITDPMSVALGRGGGFLRYT